MIVCVSDFSTSGREMFTRVVLWLSHLWTSGGWGTGNLSLYLTGLPSRSDFSQGKETSIGKTDLDGEILEVVPELPSITQ